jgi:signal transduction histidine kinase
MQARHPGTILIVDDEVAHQRILTRVLRDGGHTVHVAGGGAGAAGLAAQVAPELIILDVAMPDLDGLSVCRALKADPALAAIPVLFLSGSNDTASKTAAFAAGGADFVGKPFEGPEVLARARAHIDLYRLKTRLRQEVAARTADLRARAAANERLLAALRRERALLAGRVASRTEELCAANARLAEAMRAKDAFLVGMSHELRTPLNAILGLTAMLDEGLYGRLTPQQRQAVGTIAGSGQHLLSLINDILDLARIEAGREELHLGTVQPAEVCRAAAGMVAELARARGVTLSTRIAADAPPVRADGRRLRQILLNLLGNALKFTPAGGEVGLELASDAGGEAVRFTVWDTGAGIAEADHHRLFHAFTQVGGEPGRPEGTGLGLALVARLARLHGGSVRLTSAAGAGSRFGVAIPRDLRFAGEPRPPDGSPAVLLVDDHEQTARDLAALVCGAGYRCVVTAGGAEDCDLLSALRPRAALVTLPVDDHQGTALLPRLRARLAPGTPIVALGSVLLDDSAERALAAGAAAHLPLPLLPEPLARALRRLEA